MHYVDTICRLQGLGHFCHDCPQNGRRKRCEEDERSETNSQKPILARRINPPFALAILEPPLPDSIQLWGRKALGEEAIQQNLYLILQGEGSEYLARQSRKHLGNVFTTSIPHLGRSQQVDASIRASLQSRNLRMQSTKSNKGVSP